MSTSQLMCIYAGSVTAFQQVRAIPNCFAMSDQGSHLSEVVPICRKCQAPMVLKRLRAGRHFSYLGKFECTTCHRTVIQEIELQLTSSPTLASAITANQEN